MLFYIFEFLLTLLACSIPVLSFSKYCFSTNFHMSLIVVPSSNNFFTPFTCILHVQRFYNRCCTRPCKTSEFKYLFQFLFLFKQSFQSFSHMSCLTFFLSLMNWIAAHYYDHQLLP